MNRLARILVPLVIAALQPYCGAAYAQGFPDKPVKVINGFAAGGGSDILLRAVIGKWAELLGQQMVVDYRTGAGGNVAMEAVAKSPADGYTLLMGSPGLVTNPLLYANLPFDGIRDFAPVSLVGSVPNALVVHPSVAATTLRELVALAKSQPGKLNYASPG